ncbi:MAG: hypothetical protein J2P19_17395 [Pseudonocardia sp.]|nr:hypothetical protein [Pseudonocardia sp.]
MGAPCASLTVTCTEVPGSSLASALTRSELLRTAVAPRAGEAMCLVRGGAA